MYQNTALQTYLEQSSSVSLESIVLAEWNMNFSDNIDVLGNYRFRPSTLSPTEANFGTIKLAWAKETAASSTKYYYGATDSNTIYNVGIDLGSSSNIYNSVIDQTEQMLYSLTDVVSRFRPRSGINKLRFFPTNSYINYANSDMQSQPRFYLSSKDDKFKYWTSYRKEDNGSGGIERGLALTATGSGDYWINDAAPFVKYVNPVAANRLVIKMQTGVGDNNHGPYKVNSNTPYNDPFYEDPSKISSFVNQKTPSIWRVQYLDASTGNWTTIKSFTSIPAPITAVSGNGTLVTYTSSNSFSAGDYVTISGVGPSGYSGTFKINSATTSNFTVQNTTTGTATLSSATATQTRSTGKRVIASDGYVELAYGINNAPTKLKFSGEYITPYALPLSSNLNDAYLVPDVTNTTAGKVYYWSNSQTLLGDGAPLGYSSFTPTYGWLLKEEDVDVDTPMLTSLTSPDFFGTLTSLYTPTYREFQFIQGIRIAVSTMTKSGSTFDLIEMSPRLAVNLSDKTVGYSVEKIASDIGNTGIPVGQLLASNGSLNIFDYDQAFNEFNDLVIVNNTVTGSLVSNISSNNLQIKFYEHITDNLNNSYYVPIKTMYSDGFPKINNENRNVSIQLRDLLFYFESITAPSIMLRNVSLSFAIATLLDNVGFSNYKFYRNPGESEDKIPLFYIAPDTTVAEILNDLAQSTQTAMFFDENNNFVTMSRNYIMPTVSERATSISLYGTKDLQTVGAEKNQTTPNTPLSNIISLEAEDNPVFNGGKVVYTNRYIQKNAINLKQQSMFNRGNPYTYQPVMLWELAGTESASNPINEQVTSQSAYSLSALVLNSDRSATLPVCDANGNITENTIDVGQSIIWQTRYAGYFYANSEIIKYDAVQYELVDNTNPASPTKKQVWIQNVQDYQKYFATLPFGGQIYPTGLIRIYAEPNFNADGTISAGTCTKNGRGQFGTAVANHTVMKPGVGWLDPQYHKAFKMRSEWIYKNDHQYNQTLYKITGATGTISNATITVADTTGLKEGLLFYSNASKTIATQTPTFASGNMTITSTAHGLVPGNVIRIKGITPAAYNGIYTVVATPTVNTFTVKNTNSASGAITVAGSVSPRFNDLSWSSAISSGTKIEKIISSTSLQLSKKLTAAMTSATIYAADTLTEPLGYMSYDATLDVINFIAEKPLVTDVTKDFFDSSSTTIMSTTKTADETQPNGAIKSSALVIQGPSEFSNVEYPTNAMSYVYQNYATSCPMAYSFGTRMRIVGKPYVKQDDISAASQGPVGADLLSTITNDSGTYNIAGTGGGISINIDATNNQNTGYFFEIDALTSLVGLTDKDNTIDTIPNVFFYKVLKGANTKQAIPVVLWYGNAPILVDNGMFVGMSKSVSLENPTVYDLRVDVEELGRTNSGTYSRKFHLYLNHRLLAVVQDDDAIPVNTYNQNMALFVRGSGLCMFEHVFAIGDKSTYPNPVSNKKVAAFFDDKLTNINYHKYMMSPAIVETYLKELGSGKQPNYAMYYDEFGTIMRECAYFNVRYDKAYPALYSYIAQTQNDSQGYIVSNFRSNPYSAEFLVFNTTDFAVNLEESSKNYLRINGITFTQQSSHDLTVDEYFQKNSQLNGYSDYANLNNKYVAIQNSRNTYGRKEFSLSGNYIQNADMANSLMTWMVDKVMHPKKAIGVEIFANPMIQLGDIVTVNYSIDSVLQNTTSRFVVYHINYERGSNGPTMKLFLSEVV